jgi:hypothetical protein
VRMGGAGARLRRGLYSSKNEWAGFRGAEAPRSLRVEFVLSHPSLEKAKDGAPIFCGRRGVLTRLCRALCFSKKRDVVFGPAEAVPLLQDGVQMRVFRLAPLAQNDMRIMSLRMTEFNWGSCSPTHSPKKRANGWGTGRRDRGHPPLNARRRAGRGRIGPQGLKPASFYGAFRRG